MQQRDTSDGSARMEMFSWVAGGGDWTEKMQIDDIMLQRERVKKKKKKKSTVLSATGVRGAEAGEQRGRGRR